MFHTELLRKRLLLGASALLLTGSAALADGSGYVDCASHPEDTQVYSKARRTTDVVATVPCGEGFTVLLNGFIFSRVQTSDGRVGYIFSNLITPGRAPGSVQVRNSAPRNSGDAQPQVQASAERVNSSQPEASPATMREKIRAPRPAPTRTPLQTAEIEVKSAPAPEAAASSASSTAAAATPAAPAPAAAENTKVETSSSPTSDRAALEAKADAALSLPSAAQVMAAVNTPATSANAPASAPAETAASAASNAAATASTETAAASAAPTGSSVSAEPAPAPAQPAPASAEPSADPNAQPQPEIQPAKPIEKIKPEERWERPNAGGRRTTPLMDFYGGYAFLHTSNPSATLNMGGFMGSAAWNFKPWMQLIADSSYSVKTISGVKNVLYGNHWGPRIFIQGFGLRGHRGPGRWGITPFAEALVGGSRADTSVSGTGGYSTSDTAFSMKLGGGFDVHQSRHLEIRLLDVDYYRTGFGGQHQNNYWATAGIVIRLFGGGEE
jgi:hypothetical protein